MLLPQSTAFETLRTRLNCITSLGVLQLIREKQEVKSTTSLNIRFDELLEHFWKVQQKHSRPSEQFRSNALKVIEEDPKKPKGTSE